MDTNIKIKTTTWNNKKTRTTLFLAKERLLALRAFCVSLEVTCYKQASASSFSWYTTDYRQVIISLRKENSALRLSYAKKDASAKLAHGGYRQLIVESWEYNRKNLYRVWTKTEKTLFVGLILSWVLLLLCIALLVSKLPDRALLNINTHTGL